MKVALLDVFEDKLNESASSVGATGFVCDVTDPASCAKAVADIEAEWPGVSFLATFSRSSLRVSLPFCSAFSFVHLRLTRRPCCALAGGHRVPL